MARPFRGARFWLIVGVAAAGVVAARRLLLVINVVGDSMLPTYHHGDRVLAVRTGTRGLQRGSVVIGRIDRTALLDAGHADALPGTAAVAVAEPSFDPLMDHDEEPGGRLLVIKRLEGLPGDLVVQPDGGGARTPRPATLPAGHYALAGDAPNSRGTAQWGPVAATDIVGRVFARLPSSSQRT